MTILSAIRDAEKLLPGKKAPEGQNDPRWQAIINIGNYIESNPEDIWYFVSKWGSYKNEDLQSAIATCLLEHLLEYHFKFIFPKVEDLVCKDKIFAETFSICSKFGQSCEIENSDKFDALKNKIE